MELCSSDLRLRPVEGMFSMGGVRVPLLKQTVLLFILLHLIDPGSFSGYGGVFLFCWTFFFGANVAFWLVKCEFFLLFLWPSAVLPCSSVVDEKVVTVLSRRCSLSRLLE